MWRGSALERRIEDHLIRHWLASDVLGTRGFRILQAHGGREGLALALEHSPCLIVLDLSMPGVSGFEVARQLRAEARTRQIPILISTAMDLTPSECEELLRHVQTMVPKGGAKGLLEAFERLGLVPGALGQALDQFDSALEQAAEGRRAHVGATAA